jgi:hypothetical protein
MVRETWNASVVAFAPKMISSGEPWRKSATAWRAS